MGLISRVSSRTYRFNQIKKLQQKQKMFDFLKRKTPEQLMRENTHMLDRACREMDREKGRLEQQEKRVVADIKKQAKAGQMETVKVMAKDLVRTRQNVQKFTLMKTNMQAIKLKMTTMKATQSMAKSMAGVTKAMQRMNKTMNLPNIQKIMMEFEKQSEIMDTKAELVDDVMDDVLEDTSADADVEVAKVLSELNIEMGDKLNEAPVANTTMPSVNNTTVPEDDIEARLAALRK